MSKSDRLLPVVAVALAASLTLPAPAAAHQIELWWRYDPSFWRHNFRDHHELKALHARWHDHHRYPKGEMRRRRWRRRHERFHHQQLDHPHQALHRHAVLARQDGKASWYDLRGATGSCGGPLRGFYAAHPTWPCGTLVSVRAGDRYVFVTVMDRGPHVDGRVIDVSKRAFERLEEPSRGVVDVRIYRLDA